MILPWAVYSVKEYDLPKSESIMAPEMEVCSGHSGVLLMLLISAIFSLAMTLTPPLWPPTHRFPAKTPAIVHSPAFAQSDFLMSFRSQLHCTDGSTQIIWLAPSAAQFILRAVVWLCNISRAECCIECLICNWAVKYSELWNSAFKVMY